MRESGKPFAFVLNQVQARSARMKAAAGSLGERAVALKIANVLALPAIALRNDPSSEPLLIPLLDDKKASVRLRASAACLRLELIRSEARQKRAVKTANP